MVPARAPSPSIAAEGGPHDRRDDKVDVPRVEPRKGRERHHLLGGWGCWGMKHAGMIAPPYGGFTKALLAYYLQDQGDLVALIQVEVDVGDGDGWAGLDRLRLPGRGGALRPAKDPPEGIAGFDALDQEDCHSHVVPGGDKGVGAVNGGWALRG